MNDFASLALSRRSIRKFEDKDIPIEEIEQFIKVATSAPSGCNSQCWRFVAIKDKAVLQSIADAVIKKNEEILEAMKDELSPDYIDARKKMSTFFLNAPVVVAVFMTHLEFFDPMFITALEEKGNTHEDILRMYGRPDLLSIGAAIQTLLLAVHEKGYGACWMNDPAFAGEEIKQILGIPPEDKFISLIPIGVPAYMPRDKKMKEFDEVFKIV